MRNNSYPNQVLDADDVDDDGDVDELEHDDNSQASPLQA